MDQKLELLRESGLENAHTSREDCLTKRRISEVGMVLNEEPAEITFFRFKEIIRPPRILSASYVSSARLSSSPNLSHYVHQFIYQSWLFT